MAPRPGQHRISPTSHQESDFANDTLTGASPYPGEQYWESLEHHQEESAEAPQLVRLPHDSQVSQASDQENGQASYSTGGTPEPDANHLQRCKRTRLYLAQAQPNQLTNFPRKKLGQELPNRAQAA